MKSFSTSIIVHASREKIWNILIDIATWPTWNPTVTTVEGHVALGAKIIVHAKVSPDRTFPLTVSTYIPEERMVWSSIMPLGLFRGDRTYTLIEQVDGSVRFSLEEVFTGLMAPLFTPSIPDLQPSFDEFAAALKTHAEAS